LAEFVEMRRQNEIKLSGKAARIGGISSFGRGQINGETDRDQVNGDSSTNWRDKLIWQSQNKRGDKTTSSKRVKQHELAGLAHLAERNTHVVEATSSILVFRTFSFFDLVFCFSLTLSCILKPRQADLINVNISLPTQAELCTGQ